MSTTTHQGAVGAETRTAGLSWLRLTLEQKPIKSFPNRAGQTDTDDAIAFELEDAGIEVHRLELLRKTSGEVKTSVRGELHGWSFTRAWRYWIAEGPGIELAAADALYAAHPETVRIDGHCGCPSPREWFKGLAVGHYHVDSPAGLKGLADTIKALVARPATPAPRTDGGMTAGEVRAWPASYQETFDAIAAATKIQAGMISVSVRDFYRALSYPDRPATPAHPAGAVPDGLRALSEAATQGEWYAANGTDIRARGVLGAPLGMTSPAGDGNGLNDRAFVIALANWFRSIASHPAGQSAGSGADTVPPLLRTAFAIYDSDPGSTVMYRHCERLSYEFVRKLLSAPDSTRTGQVPPGQVTEAKRRPCACIGWPTIKILAEKGSVSFEDLDLVAASDLFGSECAPATAGVEQAMRSLAETLTNTIKCWQDHPEQAFSGLAALKLVLGHINEALPQADLSDTAGVIREESACAAAVRLADAEMGTFREAMKVDLSDFDVPATQPAGPSAGTEPRPRAWVDTVPPGWALVPVEPTRQQIDAGTAARGNTGSLDGATNSRACYRAMVAAGPEAPDTQGTEFPDWLVEFVRSSAHTARFHALPGTDYSRTAERASVWARGLQARRAEMLRTASECDDAEPGSGAYRRGVAQGIAEATLFDAPAPDSAGTGQGEAEDDQGAVQAIADLLRHHDGTTRIRSRHYDTARAIVAALAARPAAPEAQGAETLETIAQWCEDTFGPIQPARIVSRAAEEMEELKAEPARVEEAADVVICLARYPGLWETVERKMKVNRKRRWRLMGDGTGYHIKDEPAPPSSSGQGGR